MRIRRYNRRDLDWGARVNYEHHLERQRLARRRAKAAGRKWIDYSKPRYDRGIIRRRGEGGRIEITLIIEGHCTAQFIRSSGAWKCISVSDPKFDWFTRMRQFEMVRDWLRRQGFTFYWQRHRKQGAADGIHTDIIPGRDCVNPAGGKTALRVDASGVALERNGVTTSSPLNAPA